MAGPMASSPSAESPSPTPDQGPENGVGKRMGFLEHLDELRRRLVWSFLVVLVGLIGCWTVADRILGFLLDPVTEAMGTLTVIRPAEAFLNKMKAALLGGLLVALPFVFYQAWAFVSPGLYRKEKRWVIPVITAGTGLFLLGAAFSYWYAVPYAARFLASQGEGFKMAVTVDSAFAFSSKLLLGLGAVFEMPMVVFALARLGLVTARFLWKKVDVAVFICFFIAAVITPTPDMMTMTIFALPMIGLYLISIGVAFFAQRRDPAES